MTNPASIRNTFFIGIALSLSAACGGDGNVPEQGNAFLTIVGDSNMFIDHAERRVLTVRYHDGDDLPLSGEVVFEVSGDAGGSTISADSGFTNANGLVEITLNGGNIDAAFEISASAEFANPVTWDIAIGAPFSLAGNYDLDSRFDVVSGMPGDLGSVLNEIVAMTDDPNDPGKYLVELLEDEIGFSIPSFADALVNDVITQNAPDLVNKLLEIGNNFGEAARRFGIDSTLLITDSSASGDSGYVATHTQLGFNFRIDNQDFGFTNDELGEENAEVKDIGVSLSADKVTIQAHDMPIQYGGFLAKALNEVIVPMVDPSSFSLNELLAAKVDCVAVGIELDQATEGIFGLEAISASGWAGFCGDAVNAAANAVIDQLLDIDERAQVTLKITGTARMQETDGDRKVDSLTQGKWSGAIDYAGDQGELQGDVNTFTGTRISAEQ